MIQPPFTKACNLYSTILLEIYSLQGESDNVFSLDVEVVINSYPCGCGRDDKSQGQDVSKENMLTYLACD